MDPGEKKGCIVPGRSLFVPGRKRTGSERNQGTLSRPTTMTSPALRPSRRVVPDETLLPHRQKYKNRGNELNKPFGINKSSKKRTQNELKTKRKTVRNRSNARESEPCSTNREPNALANGGEMFFDDRSGNVFENKGTLSKNVWRPRSADLWVSRGKDSARGADLKVGATGTAGTKRECL